MKGRYWMMFYNLKRKNSLLERWDADLMRKELKSWFDIFKLRASDEIIREKLLNRIQEIQLNFEDFTPQKDILLYIIARDCARTLRSILRKNNEKKCGFSVFYTLMDIAKGKNPPDIYPAFYAEIINIFRGLERKIGIKYKYIPETKLKGREASILRSNQLDEVWEYADNYMNKYPDGLQNCIIKKRAENKKRILKELNATENDWNSYKWQFKNVIRDLSTAEKLIKLSSEEKTCIDRAIKNNIPFGITPYYASLMDYNNININDRAVRSQVIPPEIYVEGMSKCNHNRKSEFDFMLEHDTSPIDLITRRYPSILILKPYNSCPQICVYCQRNWEIEGPFANNAMADKNSLNQAINWIRKHNAIKEVLLTGGDPLTLNDKVLKEILDEISSINHIERIRIGSRIPVTAPMRITQNLADLLGSYRLPGKREVCLVTHVEHVYEITPDLVKAVNLIKLRGIPVYNQLVYTFYTSRRFESSKLRRILRLAGIDPYYTFLPKGKNETINYRLPIARLMQEQKEEVRLLPGLSRTDEPVFNVPGQGKNHIRALQHRDLISILPNGSRVYEFHPWEKGIIAQKTYISNDIPILDYLTNLNKIGENIDDYETIWYYF